VLGTPRTETLGAGALRCLFGGKPVLCCVEGILELALKLVGHEMPFQAESWVMSSYRGQVFYPRHFETQTLDRQKWECTFKRYDPEDKPPPLWYTTFAPSFRVLTGRALDLDLNVHGAPNFRSSIQRGLNVYMALHNHAPKD